MCMIFHQIRFPKKKLTKRAALSGCPFSQVLRFTCSWKSKWIGEPDYCPLCSMVLALDVDNTLILISTSRQSAPTNKYSHHCHHHQQHLMILHHYLWAWCTHTQKCHQTFNSQPFDHTAELIVRIRFSLTWKKKFWDCLVYVCSPFKVMRSHLAGQPTIFPQSSASHPFCRQPLPRIKSYLPSAVQMCCRKRNEITRSMKATNSVRMPSDGVFCVFACLCISLLIHGNVIFDILESHAFQKYSTCWVF